MRARCPPGRTVLLAIRAATPVRRTDRGRRYPTEGKEEFLVGLVSLVVLVFDRDKHTYSALSATTGSTRAARLDGIQHASVATTRSRAGTKPNTTGSTLSPVPSIAP